MRLDWRCHRGHRQSILCYAGSMALSDRHLLNTLSRTPFIDSTELAGILGEPHSTVHRALTGLLAEGVVGRVSHGTTHLPSSQRCFITANGLREATNVLDSDIPSDYVRAYPEVEGVAHAPPATDGRSSLCLSPRIRHLPRH